ncbi:unnamed protein product, partial [Closterium sp. Naga37s-1]
AVQAIIHKARLSAASEHPFDPLGPPPTALASFPPSLFPSSSHATAAHLSSSSQLPVPERSSLNSLPLLARGTSPMDRFTQDQSSSYLNRLCGGFSVQSSSHTDPVSRNLPVQSSGHGDPFTRDLPVQASSHMGPFTRNPPGLSSHTDPFSRKLSLQSSGVTDAFTRNLSGRSSGLADLFSRNLLVQSPRHVDPFTRNFPVQSSSLIDPIIRNLPAETSGRMDLFTRNLPVYSSHSDQFPGNVPPLSHTGLPTGNLPIQSSGYMQSSSHMQLITKMQLSSHLVSSGLAGFKPPVNEAPSTCVDPARSFFSLEDELRKLQAAGPRLPSTYECKECGRTFSLPQSLGGHMSRHRR